ncbi:hypothetical protein BJ165DRAFT_1414176 [Panaeolus papilionaceus]|nr:hypothetical protein BJ165DRAFT_1414176 [Panaeolus papilionaceus]
MARVAINLLIIFLATLGGFYQIYLKPLLSTFGIYPARVIQPRGNQNCKSYSEVQACEKLVLHQPSGLVYLACSTPERRKQWLPAMHRLTARGPSPDYIATFDPSTSKFTRLTLPDFNSGRGLETNGMDVVTSSANPNELFVYAINHRIPLHEGAWKVGADSVVEIFKTTVGGKHLTHVKTVEDASVIISPNDLVGSPDGKSFFFTNDIGSKFADRYLDNLGRKTTSVGYCHIDEGCKIALANLWGSNGIAAASNGTLYVASTPGGYVTSLEKQSDNSLVVSDTIKTGYALDNLSLDADGQLWAATIPQMLKIMKHIENGSKSPVAVARISINTGVNAFYGEKYRVENVFEDDGTVMSGLTSAAYDSKRGKLFMHGLVSPKFVVCKV